MRKPITDWFVFQSGDDAATVHATKRQAVRDAQSRGCTDKRPRRITPGHYEIFGCGGHQYWIVGKAIMQSEFPDLMVQAYEDAE